MIDGAAFGRCWRGSDWAQRCGLLPRALVCLALLMLPLFAALGGALLGADPAVAQSRPEVSGVRFGVNGATTRVVLDVDGPLRFTTAVRTAPPRLVIDLEEVRWRVRDHPQNRLEGLAKRVNFGRLDAQRSRLVVEMERPFRITREDRLPPSGTIRHHRILVDLEPLPAPPTRAAAAAPAPFAVPYPRPTPAEAPPVSVASLEPALGAGRTMRDADENGPVEPAAGPVAGPAETRQGADGAVEPVIEATPVLRPPSPPGERPVIALDAGHGGVDPGTIGINGVHEKSVTLDVARRLREILEATDRYDVVMTRDADVYVSLRERIRIARQADAALFISIHADSLSDRSFGGASVYTLSDQASDAEAGRLAAKENRADVIAGTDLSEHDSIVAGILIDLAQRVTNNKSITFADVLTGEIGEVTSLVRNTRRYAGFVVLKSPDVPSVLLELGYLSNPEDAANLAKPAYRDELAKATVAAIERYFAEVEAAL